MPNIILPPTWRIPEREAIPESAYDQWVNRRSCLKLLGLGALALTSGTPGCSVEVSEDRFSKSPKNYEFSDIDHMVYPASQNPIFELDRQMTAEHIAAQYNNFYEFSEAKDDIWKRVGPFQPRPWDLEVTGLVKKPGKFAITDLLKSMPLEERLYRHRCVEAWAMAVPWTGFPLKALLDQVEPLSQARFILFTSFHQPSVAMGQRGYGPWPYRESLTIEEATNELAILATGIYGHPLPKQHGAPIRLITPWKYGFKSIKSIVSIELVAEQPATFWNTMAPQEYDLIANVNPEIPHPRWSQKTEKMIGTNEQRPTAYLNGYARWAGHLYS